METELEMLRQEICAGFKKVAAGIDRLRFELEVRERNNQLHRETTERIEECRRETDARVAESRRQSQERIDASRWEAYSRRGSCRYPHDSGLFARAARML